MTFKAALPLKHPNLTSINEYGKPNNHLKSYFKEGCREEQARG
ncbi:MAG: hypothetical protein QXS76_02770 [Candidatus Bathyarchaeia archaeon]